MLTYGGIFRMIIVFDLSLQLDPKVLMKYANEEMEYVINKIGEIENNNVPKKEQ